MKLKTLFILAFVTLVTSPAASAQVRGTYYSLYGQQLMQANQRSGLSPTTHATRTQRSSRAFA